MPEIVFTVLKYITLVLLYLFIFLVVRSLYIDLQPQEVRIKAASRTSLKRSSAPFLKILSEETPLERRKFPLKEETVIGRAPHCQFCIQDEFASQLHSRIFLHQGSYFIEDLGSTNGTFVNGRKINYPVELRNGDRINIGKTVLEFRR
jgi:pSer/pThr/pTyr-binding forkhead associated (FHA) protein